MWKYDPRSTKADEFINHEEIMKTLEYAQEHKGDKGMLREILERAKERKGYCPR